MNNKHFTIITFYQFKKDFDQTKALLELNNFCKFNKIKGTILIANEGINGTLAGLKKDIDNLISMLKKFNFANLNLKFSSSKFMPFQKLKIKQKKEIVTFRTKFSDPEKQTGTHINFSEWNNIVNDKKTIDTRNKFEFLSSTKYSLLFLIKS